MIPPMPVNAGTYFDSGHTEMNRYLFAQLLQDDQGQDMTEYSLLIALVALVAFGLFATTGSTAAGVWNGAGTTLTSADATAGGSAPPVTPPRPPAGGRPRHGGHRHNGPRITPP